VKPHRVEIDAGAGRDSIEAGASTS